MNEGWIGVDLDGTLAHYDGWKGIDHIGEPVRPILTRVKMWLLEGREVRIFTARVTEGPKTSESRAAIEQWCRKYLGVTLQITNVKDYSMAELWDDRAVTVEQNTGRALGRSQDRFS